MPKAASGFLKTEVTPQHAWLLRHTKVAMTGSGDYENRMNIRGAPPEPIWIVYDGSANPFSLR